VVPDLLIIVLEVEDLETLLEHITEIDVFGFAKAVIQIFLKKEKSKKKKRKK
jgi:nitrate reductase NapAB chaperone NapD